MIIGSGRRDVVCGLLGEYGGELRVFRGKDGFGFAASAAAASLVAAVRRAMTGEPMGIKRELHRIIRWRVLFSRARLMYADSSSH